VRGNRFFSGGASLARVESEGMESTKSREKGCRGNQEASVAPSGKGEGESTDQLLRGPSNVGRRTFPPPRLRAEQKMVGVVVLLADDDFSSGDSGKAFEEEWAKGTGSGLCRRSASMGP